MQTPTTQVQTHTPISQLKCLLWLFNTFQANPRFRDFNIWMIKFYKFSQPHLQSSTSFPTFLLHSPVPGSITAMRTCPLSVKGFVCRHSSVRTPSTAPFTTPMPVKPSHFHIQAHCPFLRIAMCVFIYSHKVLVILLT